MDDLLTQPDQPTAPGAGEKTPPAPAVFSPTVRRRARLVVRLLGLGAILYLCFHESTHFLLPDRLGLLRQALHAAAFWVSLPTMIPLRAIVPPEGQHIPPLNTFLAAMLAPWFYWGVWRVLRLARRRTPSADPAGATQPDPAGRRDFLGRAIGGTAAVTIASGAVYTSLIEPNRLAIRRYSIPVRDLPPALDGLRIIHLSDTHYGPYTSSGLILEAIRQANALGGDLIVLTGDYVHRTPRAIPRGIAPFADLRARFGVLAVLGNHDHWEGADDCREALHDAGIPFIDNQRVFLSENGLFLGQPAGGALSIAGVGDMWEDRVDFQAALGGLPDDMPRLVLSHNPDAAEEIPPGLRVDLMLSGHTHGGQILVPGLSPRVPSQYGTRYLGGLCAGPGCPVVVSRGVGMAILPARFRVPPEIGEITLRRA